MATVDPTPAPEAKSNENSKSTNTPVKLPTNKEGKATRLWLCHCKNIQIRVFHITWFTFFLCFFGWFGTANLYEWIQPDLKLTSVDRANAGAAAVLSTVVFRVIVGWLCDKIGPRYSYSVLLFFGAFPILATALVSERIGYIIVHLFVGIIGAAFVITQYHTISMFAGKCVGAACATSAGWGNLGGGAANFVMPLFMEMFQAANVPDRLAWRYTMLIPGCLVFVMSFVYLFFTQDTPHGNVDLSQPREVEPSPQPRTQQPENEDEKTVELREVSPLWDASNDRRTWVLFFCYAGCFGVELTMLRFAAGYFKYAFGLRPAVGGSIVLAFSIVNIFARTWGGIIADVVSRKYGLKGRVRVLFGALLVEGFFLVCFSLTGENLGATIFFMICFSICVQMSEGATFAVVPFINRHALGPVAGIVGAGGNLGAAVYAFALFRFVPDQVSYGTAFLMLGVLVVVASFTTFGISFSENDELIAAADKTAGSIPRDVSNLSIVDIARLTTSEIFGLKGRDGSQEGRQFTEDESMEDADLEDDKPAVEMRQTA